MEDDLGYWTEDLKAEFIAMHGYDPWDRDDAKAQDRKRQRQAMTAAIASGFEQGLIKEVVLTAPRVALVTMIEG